MSHPITVMIAEDQHLLRSSLSMIIDSMRGLSVVGQATTGQEAVSLARQLTPDVVLMDIRMPGLSGIEATRAIATNPLTSDTRILILTMFELDEYVDAALRAGADGFLLKDTEPDSLTEAIRRVHGGEKIFAPSVLGRLVQGYLDKPSARQTTLPKGLTAREGEVLVLIARGLSNGEIAEELVISMGTVKTHIGNLLAKLQARDRAQLVIAAYESGAVESP